MSRAARYGQIEAMKVLLVAGADREARDNVSRKMCVQVAVDWRSRARGCVCCG